MKTLKNISKYVLSFILSVVCALNIVLIKPYSADIDKQNCDYNRTVAATPATPDTNYKVKVYDSSLIDEQQKHDSVLSSASNGETPDDLTEEEFIEFQILSLLYNSLCYELNNQGFEVFESKALNLDNDTIYFGLTYTEYEEINETYMNGGFIGVVKDDTVISNTENLISFNNGEDDGYRYIISNYAIERSDGHFVYYDKYVAYRWVNERTVKYSIQDNNTENYDTKLGQLFSYDECKYIYENDFTYTSVEVKAMFSDIDYDSIQAKIDEINAEQEKNGYYVSEITITIIDYDLINEWQNLSSKDSFFGYDLDSLNETFGADTTLEFTADGGVKKADLIKTKTTNWLKVGLFAAIGLAAMLIGAALAPLCGGASFGASLLLITKMTAVAVITDLAIQTTVSTITGVIQGKSFGEALRDAAKSTLEPENIAKSFMMSAIMSAVMVGSGLVKACFVEDTKVLTESGLKNIQDVTVGEKVLSYDEATAMVSAVAVTNIMRSTSDDICSVALSTGKTITSTSLHPWYVESRGWVPAYELASGDTLLTENGESVKILGVHRQKLDEPIDVYNFTVGDENDESFHTYYVGNDNVLVHNACSKSTKSNAKKGTNSSNNAAKNPSKSEIRNARQKAVRDAWKNEQKAVLNKKSKYTWTASERQQILKYGKVKGYQGCHLKDVSRSMGNLDLIGNPDNIVFLTRQQHLYVHGGSWKNATDLAKVKELLPWVVDKLTKLGL